MIPKNRPPTHPGEILFTEFLEPLKLTQVNFAKSIGIPIQRVNTIINGKRGITAETALLFADKLKTSPEFWMNLQNSWDLYEASKYLKSKAA
jgi:antitoxin HigA-1